MVEITNDCHCAYNKNFCHNYIGTANTTNARKYIESITKKLIAEVHTKHYANKAAMHILCSYVQTINKQAANTKPSSPNLEV